MEVRVLSRAPKALVFGRDFLYTDSRMWRIIIGLIIVAVGFHLVWKTEFYLDFLGRSEFAEAKIGPGGTRIFYKLIGCAVCFVGILVMTNVIQGAIIGVFGPLFKSL